MASFYNIKPEVAFEKLKSGITGETEPLKALGINLLDTQVEAYALRTGLIKLGEELSEQGKIAARYGLIMESTQKAQGDLARTMDSPTNKLRIQKAQFEEVSTSLAFSLMPQIEKAIGLYKDFGEGVVSVVKGFQSLDESQQNVILSLGGVAAATGPVILGLAGVAKATFGLEALGSGL
ncbi:hypothetical protein SDC9_203363 [bioreactor metagenome]|uniref:Phage tail tape measure protein domain-containing protein n=1 Tax=bioreactor metagenome TaxID=1076179 RepID=A0A645IYZ2_9ZZZZ